MKGQNLRIFLGEKAVAFAKSCTYHVSAQLEDKSTKDDTGDFQKQEVTGLAGDISCDALYSTGTDATGVNGVEALDMVLAGQEVTVVLWQQALATPAWLSLTISASMPPTARKPLTPYRCR